MVFPNNDLYASPARACARPRARVPISQAYIMYRIVLRLIARNVFRVCWPCTNRENGLAEEFDRTLGILYAHGYYPYYTSKRPPLSLLTAPPTL